MYVRQYRPSPTNFTPQQILAGISAPINLLCKSSGYSLACPASTSGSILRSCVHYRSALQPTTGKLFTYLPNKWTYIGALVVFELGSLICALANSSRMLIAGRIVAGLGASGLFNGAMTIIAALVPLPRRPAVTGILMACEWK